jgi:hypothetical protein
VIELLVILYNSLLCVRMNEWVNERMNEWMSRCVCLEREMCVCVDYSYIYIHSPLISRNLRVVFVFNTSESDWAPSDLIQFPVVCENECMSE